MLAIVYVPVYLKCEVEVDEKSVEKVKEALKKMNPREIEDDEFFDRMVEDWEHLVDKITEEDVDFLE